MRKNGEHKVLKIKLVDFLNQHYDLQERIKAFREKRLHTLEIELTGNCNLSCFYCYANNGRDGRTLSFVKASEIIDEAKDYRIKKFVWLGGEPTLNPNWKKVLRYSKAKGLHNELWSNGTTLLDNSEEIAQTCDEFVLHLDSTDSDIFTAVQNRNVSSRTHSKILMGLDHLLEIGYSPERIRLNIVLSKRIFPHLEETMQYFYPEKISSITLIPLFATGKGSELKLDEFLHPQELRKAFELRSLVEDRPERLLTGTAEYDKWYQLTTAYITAKGDIIPYAGINISMGNIYKNNLRGVLERFFDKLSFAELVNQGGDVNYIEGSCGTCENSNYCFGTRAQSFFTTGKLNQSDLTCWKNKNGN